MLRHTEMALQSSNTAANSKSVRMALSGHFRKRLRGLDDAGFTLVEVIASLLIVGVLGAIAGMGIVNGMQGYMQTKENAHLAQKTQVSVNRIGRELMELTDIIARNDGSDPWVIFDNPIGRQGLAKVGNTLQLYTLSAGATDLSGATGDIVVDKVDSLTVSYHSGSDPDWIISDGIDMLSAVQVDINLLREEGGGTTLPFSIMVNPRNTKNFGGASLQPSDFDRAAKKYDCFISASVNDTYFKDTPYVLKALMSVITACVLIVLGIAACRKNHRHQGRNTGMGSRIRDQRGNVLVGLVVTMLLFAALGAGMVTMTSTSSTNQVLGNTTVRAYYIAEAGFRYAASRYLNTADTNSVCRSQDEKNQTLANLHDDLFTLGNDDGRFRLKVFPYYLTANGSISAGSTGLPTKFSGGKPVDFTLPPIGINARLKIDDTVYFYDAYNDSTGQLTLSQPLQEDVCDNAVITLIGIPAGSATLTKLGDLTLADAGFFPKTQGRFKIAGDAYGYVARNGNTLQQIINVDEPEDPINMLINTTTEVVLEPFAQIRSIGMVDQGEFAATREVIYSVPLPEQTSTLLTTDEDSDPFNDDSKWQSPTYGNFAVQNYLGDSALAVTGTQSGFNSPKASLIAFDWTNSKINFASAHRSTGRFLSYDAQTKILFDLLSQENWTDGDQEGSAPDRLPKYFMAGIAFRLDENLNTYGLSLTRGSAFTPPTPDNIAQELIPQDQTPMLALWQQTDDGASTDWLAYGVLPGSIIFSDDMESGSNGWSVNIAGDDARRWERVLSSGCSNPGECANSGEYSWTTSPTGSSGGFVGAYEDGENIALVSPSIDLSAVASAILTFWTRYRLYSCDDYGYVEICENGTCASDLDWTRLNDRPTDHCTGGTEPENSSYADYTSNSESQILYPGNVDGWVKKVLDISDYAGQPNVKIRFLFDRDNNPALTRNGWWIDDVKVVTKEFIDLLPVPPDPAGEPRKAAVMVRVFEAAVIQFNSGGTTPIEVEDIVTQSNGAIGVVVVPPVLESSDWGADSAAGTLWLNKISPDNDFQNGDLDVLGKGTNLATVTGYTSRTNLIKAYFNNLADTGSPSNSPYDLLRRPENRNEIRWPANEGEVTNANNDYFTLIEWDIDINRDPDIPLSQQAKRLKDENGKYTIIATDSLSTPSDTFFPYTRPEIGLQAFGHGAVDLYFDDFGIQVYRFAGSGFLQPIQQ